MKICRIIHIVLGLACSFAMCANLPEDIDSIQPDTIPNLGAKAAEQGAKAAETVSSSMPGWGVVWLVVVTLLAIGAIVLVVWKLNETEERFSKKKKELLKEIESLKTKIKEMEEGIENVKKENRTLSSDLGSTRKSLSKLTTESAKTASSAPGMTHTATPSKVNKEQIFFVGSPTLEVFRNPVSFYDRYEHLYQITTYDNERGTFVFINNPSSLAIAKDSRTDNVESACFVEGENPDNYDRIVTVKPGEVRRVGDNWKIVTKARIRFE